MKKFANHHSYSDVHPYEVIREVSEKCLEVRQMKSEKDPNFVPDIDVGGFVGHVSNNHEQTWIIESDPTRPIVRIRLHKTGKWKDKHGNTYYLSDKPKRFYDYNF